MSPAASFDGLTLAGVVGGLLQPSNGVHPTGRAVSLAGTASGRVYIRPVVQNRRHRRAKGMTFEFYPLAFGDVTLDVIIVPLSRVRPPRLGVALVMAE